MPKEQHRMSRVGWLRAGVLGANDGLLSTASLVVGVAAAGSWSLRGGTREILRGIIARGLGTR